MNNIRKLPEATQHRRESPEIVLLMDRVRYNLENQKDESFYEVCWFLREHPRIFRHHFECAQYRLFNIYSIYRQLLSDFEYKLSEDSAGVGTVLEIAELEKKSQLFELSISDLRIKVLYWDFESLLASICMSLDTMARILSVAYKEQLPASFNQASKKKERDEIIDFLVSEKTAWVDGLKDYRDCFTHYTPVDTLLSMKLVREEMDWVVWGKLPSNPNERDITRFEFSPEYDVLCYSIEVFSKLVNFDHEISKILESRYNRGVFPVSTSGLFYVGKRERT